MNNANREPRSGETLKPCPITVESEDEVYYAQIAGWLSPIQIPRSLALPLLELITAWNRREPEPIAVVEGYITSRFETVPFCSRGRLNMGDKRQGSDCLPVTNKIYAGHSEKKEVDGDN